MANRFYNATVYIFESFTGTDSIDNSDGNNLKHGDLAYVYINGIYYHFVLNDYSKMEGSPPSEDIPQVIEPKNADQKRWEMFNPRFRVSTEAPSDSDGVDGDIWFVI